MSSGSILPISTAINTKSVLPNINIGNAATTATNVGTNAAYDPTIWDTLFGYTDTNTNVSYDGLAIPGIQALGGLAQSWLGFQNLNLAKDQFAFQKGAFNDQYNQQVQQYNTMIADRANSRLGFSEEDAANYIAKNSLQERG